MKIEFLRQIFEKYWNIKFRQNPSSESRVVQCGRAERQTNMMKLIFFFFHFAKTPKKQGENGISDVWYI